MDTSINFPGRDIGDRLGGPVRRVVLLGFMASGKTTVGAALAPRLGWEHLDFDREIERREGRSIVQIFREDGEPYFRSLECDLTAELANRSGLVLSPGGGWITNPGVLRQLGRGTFSFWLNVRAKDVLLRLGSRWTSERPLLRTRDRVGTINRLLEERLPYYRAADHVIHAGWKDVETIVKEIEGCVEVFGLAPEQD